MVKMNWGGIREIVSSFGVAQRLATPAAGRTF
jgi:hypothetical protein